MTGMLVDLGAVPVAQVSVAVVPVQNPEPPPGEGEEFGKASPVALVLILLMAVATALLVRSMSKRIRKLPTSFDEPSPANDATDETPAAGR